MAEIHKITSGGDTIYPATTTDAVIHPTLKSSVTGIVNDYNVSTLFPSHSISGTNRYTLSEAIRLLGNNLEEQQKGAGVRVIFVNDSAKLEVWEFQGGIFENQLDWLPCSANTISDLPAQDITELVRRAELAATNASQSAALAEQSGELAQFAKTQGDYAKDQGDYAKTQAGIAKTQADYAKEQGDYAKNMATGLGTDLKDLKDKALLKTSQTLTEAEKTQVHNNIGLSEKLLYYTGWIAPKYDSSLLYTNSAGEVLFEAPIIGLTLLSGLVTMSTWNESGEHRIFNIPLGICNTNTPESGATTLNRTLGGELKYYAPSIYIRLETNPLSGSQLEINSLEYIISNNDSAFMTFRIDSIIFYSISKAMERPVAEVSTMSLEGEEVTPPTTPLPESASPLSVGGPSEFYTIQSPTESLEITAELLGTIPSDLRGSVREVSIQTPLGLERTYRLEGSQEESNFFNPKSWISVKAEIEGLKCCLGHENPLTGLKVVVLGDSLTCSPESWATDLATELGWLEIALWAVPGATLAKNAVGQNFPDLIENLGTLEWEPDLVIVCPGIGRDVEFSFLGSFKDTGTCNTFGIIPTKANKGTVRGGIRYISEVTHKLFPTTKLMFTELLYGPAQKPSDLFLKSGTSVERAEIDTAIHEGSRRFQYQVLPLAGCGIHPWAPDMMEGDDIPRLTERGRINLRAHIKTELARLFKKTI